MKMRFHDPANTGLNIVKKLIISISGGGAAGLLRGNLAVDLTA